MPGTRRPPAEPGVGSGKKKGHGVDPNVLATMVTTTSYGTWLPGDARGYVADGQILPGDPKLLDRARSLLAHAPVYFDDAEQDALLDALCDAAVEFGYRLTDVSVESWHLHWLASHGYDLVSTMVGRLKTRMRQALDRGRIWTEGYCHRCLYAPEEIEQCRRYIARHRGCRMLNGKRVSKS